MNALNVVNTNQSQQHIDLEESSFSQIDLILDAEKSLPGRFRRRFVARKQVIYPNQRKKFLSKLKQSGNFTNALETALKAEKVCNIYLHVSPAYSGGNIKKNIPLSWHFINGDF